MLIHTSEQSSSMLRPVAYSTPKKTGTMVQLQSNPGLQLLRIGTHAFACTHAPVHTHVCNVETAITFRLAIALHGHKRTCTHPYIPMFAMLKLQSSLSCNRSACMPACAWSVSASVFCSDIHCPKACMAAPISRFFQVSRKSYVVRGMFEPGPICQKS